MFENIVREDVISSLSMEELQQLNDILKDIPPYDTIENAEKKAQAMYKTYASTYKPYVKKIEGNEKDGISYLIGNAKGTDNQSMWVDSYISSYDNELVIEYNQYIFDLHNWHDVLIKKFQEDNDIFENIYYTILEYNSANGLYQTIDN